MRSSIMKIMILPIIIGFAPSILTSCIHTKAQTLYPTPKLTQLAAPKRVTTKQKPIWLTSDCTKDGEYFYFVGYGEGPTSTSATQNALIDARKNALLCIFGGAIEFSSNTKEDISKIDYTAGTTVRVSSDHVDWSGFEKVLGSDFFPYDERDAVYIQYRWQIKQIDTSKKKLALIQQELEKNKALQKQVEATQVVVKEKSELIEQQKKELEKLKQQEIELESIKNEAEKSIKKISMQRKQYFDKKTQFSRIVTQLYCGITLGEFISAVGEPDEEQVLYDGDFAGGYLQKVVMRWDTNIVEMSADQIFPNTYGNKYRERGFTTTRASSEARKIPIKFIYVDRKATGRGYKICE
jgi:hypothetical protein